MELVQQGTSLDHLPDITPVDIQNTWLIVLTGSDCKKNYSYGDSVLNDSMLIHYYYAVGDNEIDTELMSYYYSFEDQKTLILNIDAFAIYDFSHIKRSINYCLL